MRLLLDEMLAGAIAEQLRRRDRDANATVEHPELRGLDDPALFERAQTLGRAIVTYNRDDFLALDRLYRADGREHRGVVILNPRRFPQGSASVGALVKSLDALLTAGPPYTAFVHWLR